RRPASTSTTRASPTPTPRPRPPQRAGRSPPGSSRRPAMRTATASSIRALPPAAAQPAESAPASSRAKSLRCLTRRRRSTTPPRRRSSGSGGHDPDDLQPPGEAPGGEGVSLLPADAEELHVVLLVPGRIDHLVGHGE